MGLACMLVAPALLPLRAHAATGTAPPPAAEEISIASLGLPAQVVHGVSPSLDVRFPTPAADLSSAGSYLRVFFGHSSTVGPGATLETLVNGQKVDDVALTASTASGAVFVVEVPSAVLHADRPNLAEFNFALGTAPPQAGDLFGRVAAETALHYQLAPEAGTIAAYPYSLLGGSLFGALADVPLGVVIPTAPHDQELSAALRLVADTSRRLRGATLHTTLVSSDQHSWLQSARSPVLLVGRLTAIPDSDTVLQAAGFTRSDGEWTIPGGSAPATADDGILAAVVSPWDGHSPLLLVSGGSDEGVARAAAAVLRSPQAFPDHAGVVTGPTTGGAGAPDAGTGSLLPDQLSIQGPGDHVLALGLPVAATAAPFPASLHLTLSVSPTAAGLATWPDVTLEVGGRMVAQPPSFLGIGATASRVLDMRPALRPGMNGVMLNLRLPDAAGAVHADATLVNPRPLPAQTTASTLGQLPSPFLDGRGDAVATVALADLRPTTVGAAVTAMAALGSRAVVAPAALSVVVLGRDKQLPRATTGVLVVGGPAGEPLRLRSGVARSEAVSPPTAAADGRAGWIVEAVLSGGVPALWVGGSPSMLATTAAALSNPSLGGRAAVVRPDAPVPALTGARPASSFEPLTTGVARLLPLLAGAVLLGLVALTMGLQRKRAAR